MHDQPIINNEQTLLPARRNRRPGSSSSQPPIFELKHPFIFDLISGNYDIPLWDAFRSWVRDGLLTKHDKKKHDQDHYNKHLADFPVAINLGVLLINNKNWFYNLYFEGQLLDNSHIDVIFYYLRKKAKYEVGSSYKYTTTVMLVVLMKSMSLVNTLEVNDYYKNKGIDSSQAQEENEFFDIVYIDNVPQQIHETLDCGIYMLAFAEYLSYEQGIPAGNLDASFLRSRYATLLWNYGQQKNDAGAISDNEAPPRHSMLNVALEDNDTIQID
ncbi:hypothetical protein KY290_034195 [Solanum tuberosum]|uniref:Ubiquitin-like protease family profile domain-containing protein n=1 Tax=Solanum tuberosum TaxID=4113 RepID=A0ABQ7U4H5_SOLTU|nr:hypothetical protein KY289_033578 [Solanum tuberosum]KAH0741152.1 hypothetical protein KY290_034195 [Solanum tuberosum]